MSELTTCPTCGTACHLYTPPTGSRIGSDWYEPVVDSERDARVAREAVEDMADAIERGHLDGPVLALLEHSGVLQAAEVRAAHDAQQRAKGAAEAVLRFKAALPNVPESKVGTGWEEDYLTAVLRGDDRIAAAFLSVLAPQEPEGPVLHIYVATASERDA